MPRRYQRPPLTEALCEFQFAPTEAWDWTIPGLIYSRIKADFPVKREQPIVEMQLRTMGANAPEEVRHGIARMRFLTPDETGVVQVAPNLLVVNRLPPYPGWAYFRTLVLAQLDTYVEVAEPKALGRVSLRYLNRVSIPAARLDLSHYFHALPGLPVTLMMRFVKLETSKD